MYHDHATEVKVKYSYKSLHSWRPYNVPTSLHQKMLSYMHVLGGSSEPKIHQNQEVQFSKCLKEINIREEHGRQIPVFH